VADPGLRLVLDSPNPGNLFGVPFIRGPSSQPFSLTDDRVERCRLAVTWMHSLMETSMSNTAAAPTAPQTIHVARNDLPLSCPLPDAPVWNMHPRIYLPIQDEPNHESVCPYCGAYYVLTD
jgi:uncharacterized Zn-finger protein